MGAKNILIDFYEAEDLRSFAMRHGITIQNWNWYEAKFGVKWPDTKFYLDFQDDQKHVRRIVDNFFDHDRISVEDVNWLEEVNLKLVWHVFIRGEQPKSEEWVDLSKKQVLRSRFQRFHNFLNQRIHTELLEEILKMISKQDKAVKSCAVCGVLFEPTARGHGQIYCSNSCKMQAYRKRKKEKRYERQKKDLTS